MSAGVVLDATVESEGYAAAAQRSSVAIVTVSNRPHQLAALAEEVDRQEGIGLIEHIVVLDGLTLNSEIARVLLRPGRPTRVLAARAQPERYLFERIGALRNVGVDHSTAPLVALWDDDNRWEATHLASLHCLLTGGVAAAHSHRTLWRGGELCVVEEGTYPWAGAPHVSTAMYRLQRDAGILTSGSAVVRDRHGFEFAGELCSCVDTGEWLLSRTLFDDPATRFQERFGYRDVNFGVTDDNIFGFRLLAAGVRVRCSEQPTLRYTLGGNSQVRRS